MLDLEMWLKWIEGGDIAASEGPGHMQEEACKRVCWQEVPHVWQRSLKKARQHGLYLLSSWLWDM
jgi:hypothetical protein